MGKRRKYVRVRFKPHGEKAKWYWAIKIKKGTYQRVTRDGNEILKERKRKSDGVLVQTKELLIGEPLEELPAYMSKHYGEIMQEDDPHKEESLPSRRGESIKVQGPGRKSATVKLSQEGSYLLRIDGTDRVRWGDKEQITEDIEHFEQYGVLPSEKGIRP